MFTDISASICKPNICVSESKLRYAFHCRSIRVFMFILLLMAKQLQCLIQLCVRVCVCACVSVLALTGCQQIPAKWPSSPTTPPASSSSSSSFNNVSKLSDTSFLLIWVGAFHMPCPAQRGGVWWSGVVRCTVSMTVVTPQMPHTHIEKLSPVVCKCCAGYLLVGLGFGLASALPWFFLLANCDDDAGVVDAFGRR